MAILGGAGNPVGDSFTGAAEALEIYGDHAAAYSGAVQVGESLVTHIDFTSGNYLFVGTLTFTGPVDSANAADGATAMLDLSFNGNVIMRLKTKTDTEQMPMEVVVPLIIPPYTEVKVAVDSTVSSGGVTTTANIIGKIFRE